MQILPGRSYPLGATFDGKGTNFSVFSQVAEQTVITLNIPPDVVRNQYGSR